MLHLFYLPLLVDCENRTCCSRTSVPCSSTSKASEAERAASSSLPCRTCHPHVSHLSMRPGNSPWTCSTHFDSQSMAHFASSRWPPAIAVSQHEGSFAACLLPLSLPELPLFPSAPAASGEPSVPSEKPVWLVGSSSCEYATSLCISSNLHQIKCMSSRSHYSGILTKNQAQQHNRNDLLPAWLPDVADVQAAALVWAPPSPVRCQPDLHRSATVLQHRRSNAGTFRIQILQAQACSAWARESAADDLERLSSCSSARASDDPPPVSEYLGANSELIGLERLFKQIFPTPGWHLQPFCSCTSWCKLALQGVGWICHFSEGFLTHKDKGSSGATRWRLNQHVLGWCAPLLLGFNFHFQSPNKCLRRSSEKYCSHFVETDPSIFGSKPLWWSAKRPLLRLLAAFSCRNHSTQKMFIRLQLWQCLSTSLVVCDMFLYVRMKSSRLFISLNVANTVVDDP